jgi:hypothetical protein
MADWGKKGVPRLDNRNLAPIVAAVKAQMEDDAKLLDLDKDPNKFDGELFLCNPSTSGVLSRIAAGAARCMG